jgi:hypothetical protein
MLYISLLGVSIVYGYVLSKRAIASVLKSVSDTGHGAGGEGGNGGAGGDGGDIELAGNSSEGDPLLGPGRRGEG